MPHDAPTRASSGLLAEGGWRPPPPATPAEAALAGTVRRLLPQAARLLWNVRDDLPVLLMAEVMAERMRLLGHAASWRDIEALERELAAARAGQPPC